MGCAHAAAAAPVTPQRRSGATGGTGDETHSQKSGGKGRYYKDAERVGDQQNCVRNPTCVLYHDETGGIARINNYHAVRMLGEGSFGQVLLCVDEDDVPAPSGCCCGGARRVAAAPAEPPQQFAVKVLAREHVKKTELDILVKVNHANVVRLLEYIDDASSPQIFLVFEVLGGGPLARMGSDGKLEEAAWDEARVRTPFKQVCEGLNHLHMLGIIHRDIKPDNIVLDAQKANAKLIDFGESRLLKTEIGDDSSRKTVGTPIFLPPEAMGGDYYSGKASDVWALGVVLHLLLIGQVPFGAGVSNQVMLWGIIEKAELKLPDRPVLSSHVKDLLSRLLEKDLTLRITLPEVLAHPWLEQHTKPLLSGGDSPRRLLTTATGSTGAAPPGLHNQMSGLSLTPSGLNPSLLPQVSALSALHAQVQPSDMRISTSSRQGHPGGGVSPRPTPGTGARVSGAGDLIPESPGMAMLRDPVEHQHIPPLTPLDKSGPVLQADRPKNSPRSPRPPNLDPTNVRSPVLNVHTLEEQKGAGSSGSDGSCMSSLASVIETNKMRILIVDDVFQHRQVISKMILECIRPGRNTPKVEIDHADDGDPAYRAVVAAARDGEPYAVVLMDIHMPAMSGFDAAKLIRLAECEEGLLDTPIVGITADPDHQAMVRLSEDEAVRMNAMVFKPMVPEKASALVNWLGLPVKQEINEDHIFKATHKWDSFYRESMQRRRRKSAGELQINWQYNIDMNADDIATEDGDSAPRSTPGSGSAGRRASHQSSRAGTPPPAAERNGRTSGAGSIQRRGSVQSNGSSPLVDTAVKKKSPRVPHLGKKMSPKLSFVRPDQQDPDLSNSDAKAGVCISPLGRNSPTRSRRSPRTQGLCPESSGKASPTTASFRRGVIVSPRSRPVPRVGPVAPIDGSAGGHSGLQDIRDLCSHPPTEPASANVSANLAAVAMLPVALTPAADAAAEAPAAPDAAEAPGPPPPEADAGADSPRRSDSVRKKKKKGGKKKKEAAAQPDSPRHDQGAEDGAGGGDAAVDEDAEMREAMERDLKLEAERRAAFLREIEEEEEREKAAKAAKRKSK